MAKNNNLTDFVTGVADAIRTKKGTTDLINPQNFESEILSIETGGGGTSAVLGELNVSSNGTYEAGGKMTLVPGGMYQFKEQLPVETLAELYSATQGNNGKIFSIVYEGIPLTQLTIYKKTNDIYILESSTYAKVVENIYSTGTATFTYFSAMSNRDVTVELIPGWNTFTPQGKTEVPVLSSIRLPQDISGIPGGVINLVDVQFDTSNCVEAIPDKSSIAITIKNLGQFVKLTGGFDLTKRLSPVSLGNIDEFNPDPNGEMVMLLLIQRSIAFSDLQDDIDGIKYLKMAIDPPIFLMYIEDNSKIQVTSGTAENGCWYLAFDMYFGDDYPWIFAYGKDPVDGYNKVTVNVTSQPKLQSKTATINGVYSPDEGFDGLSQVTVDFALQNKTITEGGTYTCDEGYGGLGQVDVIAVDSRTLLDGGKLAVHSVIGADDLSLDPNKATIEELIVNKGVTSISNGGEYANLKRAILPDTLETVGYKAFYNCSRLTNVTMPDSVTSIGNRAFEGCSVMTSAVIGNHVKSIGDRAFWNCSRLASITIPDSVTRIGEFAFRDCYKLAGVYINDLSAWSKIRFTSGDSNPLYYARNLYLNGELVTDVVIPNDVKSIENYIFYNCSNLTGFTIGSGVQGIGNYALSGCSGLTSISIPDNVVNIREGAFSRCSGMTSVTIGNGVTNIGEAAFANCTSLRSITIPDNVTSIGKSAFSGCSGLTSVTIPYSVTSINYGAFYQCSGLTSIVIPDSVTIIEQEVFSQCSGLTNVTIPDSVTRIRGRAFYQCSALTSITIPNGVISIGDHVFGYCSKLATINILATTPPTLDSTAFNNTALTKIVVPAGCGETYKAAANWSTYADYIIEMKE